MKRRIINLTYILILLLGSSSILNAQVEEDSLVTEIDSLLSLEVMPEEFINSASKYDQTPEEAPSAISIITAKEIEAYGYQNLSDILNNQRGFYISNDRVFDYVGVRGFRRGSDHNNRILLLFNGHRLNTYQTDYIGINKIDISNLERVEIVRGPGSTLYGNNAVHAVINLIPKKNTDSYLPSLTLKYGSYNNRSLGLITTKKLNKNLSFSIYGNYKEIDGEDLYFKEFDTPENNNGMAINQNALLYKSLIGNIKYKQFSLSGMLNQSKRHVPTAPYNTKFNATQINYSNSSFLDFVWSPSLTYNKFLILKLSYDYENYGGNLPFKFIPDDVLFNGEVSTIGTEVQFVWDIFQNNRIITGMEYKNNFNSKYKYSSGDIKFVDDIWSYKLFSLFFQNEYQFNSNLSIYFGLRSDSFFGQETAFNPRAGIVYSPFTKHTFKLLYGKSFRAPNMIERNLEEKNIVRIKRNENLTSEYITTAELIWDYKITNKISSTFSVYNYNMEGLIDQVLDPVDDLLQYVNLGVVRANGAEIELNYKNGNNGSGYFRYSYQLANNKAGAHLTNSPEHLLKLGVTNKIFSLLNGAFDLVYETKRKTIYNIYTRPILLADLNLYTEPIFNHFKISLKIKNLFNKTIKYPGGYELIQKSIVQPYRNYIFTISFEL